MTNIEIFQIESLSPLYEAVQTSGRFPDSKFFVDCTPKSAPETILEAYKIAVLSPDFNLENFVETHFELPQTPDTGYQSTNKPISEHLHQLWDVLKRSPTPPDAPPSSLIPLPNPYIVPGGRFREVYYWDSYFTMLGLRVSGRVDIIQDMVDNFSYLIDNVGFVPNGNRSYYLGRSQPPFFALMVNLLADLKGPEILLQYRHQLEKEYAFWMAGEHKLEVSGAHRRVVALGDGYLLNRYWDDNPAPRPEAYLEDQEVAHQSGRDPETVYRHIRAAAESGWDFSSRWFADESHMETIQTTDLVPVDLNCLLYYLEKTLLNIYRQLPDRVPVEVFKERSRLRKNAIQQYCWNNAEGFYFDYNHAQQKPSGAWTLAAVSPLFFNIATPEQAARIARHLEEKFLQAGGVRTTLHATGQQWDAPNGWAPLQWLTYKGLRNYGHDALAEKIRQHWMALNEKTYADTGKMMEKYNVSDLNQSAGGGEYPNQDGFGWTNGVYLAMQEVDLLIKPFTA
jgi:alpha,alpha-trehalase